MFHGRASQTSPHHLRHRAWPHVALPLFCVALAVGCAAPASSHTSRPGAGQPNTSTTTTVHSNTGGHRARRTNGGAIHAATAPVEPLLFIHGTDGALWTRDSSAGASWRSLGGVITNAPAGMPHAVTYTGLWQVFARGSDGAVWRTTSSDGVTWNAWASVGGSTPNSPAAATEPNGAHTYRLFVRGSDSAIWTRTGTTGWVSLAGQTPHEPTAYTNNTTGRLRVVVTASDGTLWADTSDNNGTSWSGWTLTPGTANTAPSGDLTRTNTPWNTDQQIVAVRHSDNAILETSTGAWTSLAGNLTTGPFTINLAQVSSNQVFARGTDSAVWMRATTDAGHTWAGWTSLGGIIIDKTAAETG